MTEKLAYWEWSAPEGSDLDDPAALRQANPAMAAGRITEEFCRIERAAMDDDEYARERLGIFPDNDDALWSLFDAALWQAGMVPNPGPDFMADPPTFALEIMVDRSLSAIAAAGLHPDGRTAIEVIEHRPVIDAGKDWIVARFVELNEHNPKAVLVDPRSPAGPYIRPLTDAGIEITEVTSADYAKACASTFDAHRAGTLAYHEGNPELHAAAAATTKRQSGDVWYFDRRGKTPIVALAAAALARWGHLEIEAPPPISIYESRGAVVL